MPMTGFEFCLEIDIDVLPTADDLDDLRNPDVTGLEVSPCFSDSRIKEVGDEGEAETREAEVESLVTLEPVTVL